MHVQQATFVASAESLSRLPAPAFAEIAFAGRSNVGKSSLMNRLAARKKLVRTSSTPGCTRAINVFRLELTGLQREGTQSNAESSAILDFVDLPGFGYAKRSKAERKSWGPLVENFLEHRPGLRGVVLLVDVRRGFEHEEHQLLEFLTAVERTALCVATKLDKLPANKRQPELKKLRSQTGQRIFGVSATEGLGIPALWQELLRMAAIA